LLAILMLVALVIGATIVRRVFDKVLSKYSDNMAVNRILTNMVYIAIISLGCFRPWAFSISTRP